MLHFCRTNCVDAPNKLRARTERIAQKCGYIKQNRSNIGYFSNKKIIFAPINKKTDKYNS